MRKSLKGRFFVWDLGTDSYNHIELAKNWDAVDNVIGGPDGSTGLSSPTSYPQNVETTWVGSNSQPYGYFNTERFPGGGYGYEQQITGKSLYNVISGLNYNDVPLGTVVSWWTPFGVYDSNGNIAPGGIGTFLPDGWAICDGSALTADQHSFGNFVITLPDLRNKTVLGATNLKQGIEATGGNYDLISGTHARPNDGAASAPGVGYDSGAEAATGIAKTGTNVVRDISHSHSGTTLTIPNHTHDISSHVHNIPSHRHSVNSHTHDISHQHLMPNHRHSAGNLDMGMDAHNPGYDRKVKKGDDYWVSQRDHVHNIRGSSGETGGRVPLGIPFLGDQNLWPYYGSLPGDRFPGSLSTISYASVTSMPMNLGSGNSSYFVSRSSGGASPNTNDVSQQTQNAITNSGTQAKTSADVSNNVISGDVGAWTKEINPRTDYVGLLYIMKVKVSTNII